jgi:hypothetical protein
MRDVSQLINRGKRQCHISRVTRLDVKLFQTTTDRLASHTFKFEPVDRLRPQFELTSVGMDHRRRRVRQRDRANIVGNQSVAALDERMGTSSMLASDIRREQDFVAIFEQEPRDVRHAQEKLLAGDLPSRSGRGWFEQCLGNPPAPNRHLWNRMRLGRDQPRQNDVARD